MICAMNFWVYNNGMNEIIFRYLNSFAGVSVFGDKVIVFFATTFSLLLILAAAGFLFWHQDNRPRENAWFSFRRKAREVFFVFFVSLVSWFIATLLKEFLQNPRPYDALTGVVKLFDPNDSFSLPSGHATFFSALAVALYFYHRRLGLLFGFGALLIGLARVISGIHYPVDILAGFGLGIVFTGMVAYFRKKV